MRLDAKCWVGAMWRLDEALPVRTFQRDAFEEYDHDQVQTPHLVRLPQAVDPADFPLLVWVGEHAARVLLPSNTEHKVFTILLTDVFAEFRQQPGCPFLLDFGLLAQQLVFDRALFVLGHPLLVLLEVLAFPGLKVEPCVGNCTDMGKKCLNEGMKFILLFRQREKERKREKLSSLHL